MGEVDRSQINVAYRRPRMPSVPFATSNEIGELDRSEAEFEPLVGVRLIKAARVVVTAIAVASNSATPNALPR